MQAKSVLATMTGRDRPGVTAALLAALAAHDVDVRDIEQVVVTRTGFRGAPAERADAVT